MLNQILQRLVSNIWIVPYLILIYFTLQQITIRTDNPTVQFNIKTVDMADNTLGFEVLNSVSPYHPFEATVKASFAPKYSYNVSFLTNARKDAPTSILCKLNLNTHCISSEVAEVIDTFWVICPAYASYQTFIQYRYILHENYKSYIESFGLPFSTIEAIRADRKQEYLLTKPGNEPYDIQVEFYDDMYIRENLLNVAARKIPNWAYIAWIDTHQPFENVYWWEESIIKMEKYAIVQNFQYLANNDLKNNTEYVNPSGTQLSLFKTTFDGVDFLIGNAYSIERSWYEKIGHIYDECVASCCDCAWMLGSVTPDYVFTYFHHYSTYNDQMLEWINQTQKITNASRAVIRGIITHLYHERNFGYVDTLKLINVSDFNLKRDLARDDNFTLRLVNEDIRKIFNKNTFWTNFDFYMRRHQGFSFLYNDSFIALVVTILIAFIVQRKFASLRVKWSESSKQRFREGESMGLVGKAPSNQNISIELS